MDKVYVHAGGACNDIIMSQGVGNDFVAGQKIMSASNGAAAASQNESSINDSNINAHRSRMLRMEARPNGASLRASRARIANDGDGDADISGKLDDSAGTASASESVELRRWIEGALNSAGVDAESDSSAGAVVASSAYAAASLRIAVSLAEQIGRAEEAAENGNSDERDLNLLPVITAAGTDWAEHVRVLCYEFEGENCTVGTNEKLNNLDLQSIGSWESSEVDGRNLHRPWPSADANTNGDLDLQQTGDREADADDEWLHEDFPLATCMATSCRNEGGAATAASLEIAGDRDEGAPDINLQLERFLDEFEKKHSPPEVERRTPNFRGKALLDTSDILRDVQASDDQGTNEQFEAFLRSFDNEPSAHENIGPAVLNAAATVEGTPASQEDAPDSTEKVEAFRKPYCDRSTSPTMGGTAASSYINNLSYLNVDFAEITVPEGERSNIIHINSNTIQDKLQRIKSLGLVFYELFSGGKAPPPTALVQRTRSTESLSQNTASQGRGGHFKRFSSSGRGVCNPSLEYLKLMGLPGPLCDLIFDMIECMDGISGDGDCYTKINDVICDLQLMINNPSKFLQDLDVQKLSVSGLQLGDAVLSREEELSSIQSCYHRCITAESSELVVIAGPPGTGKTWLAQSIGTYIVNQGGLFLTGKFGVQQARPFSALASAFDQYCDILLRNIDSDWVKRVIFKLNFTLGDDASHQLIMVIPTLSQIITCDPRYKDSMYDQDSLHAVQRLRYFLDQFLDVIVTNSNVAVTLFMDDVHNADAASVLLLNQFVMKRRKNLFFLTCSREDDTTGSHHPFWDMVENSGAFGINTTKVQLGCMSEKTLNTMVSHLLCQTPRRVKKLSDLVYRKTRGNTLFFYQLMLSLNRYGLLNLSLSQKKWVWDEKAIEAMKLPDDVAHCFLDGINRLPLEVKSALHTLSCFGQQTLLEYMELLEQSLGVSLTSPLDKAAAEGLVSRLKRVDGTETYHFCHDLLQQTAYEMMQEEIRFKEHSLYGLSLVKHSIESGNDDMLFVAVNQINLGGREAVTDAEEHVNIARYNLLAAKKAVQMSYFSSASSFLCFGIKFLPENCWRDHFHLSLELYEAATKAALATGDMDSLLTYSGEVLKNSHCFEDKLETYFLIMSSLGHSINASIAIHKGLEILSQLGEDLPHNLSQQDLIHQAMQTQMMIKDLSRTDLLNYRLMTDKKKLWAMKSLAKMMVIALMENPILQPALVLKMVQLTLNHGLCETAAIAFVYYGSMLAKRANIQEGYEFILLAKALLDKFEEIHHCKPLSSMEVMVTATQVQCFLEPTQALALDDMWAKGESLAMTIGDVHFGCLFRTQKCFLKFGAGVKLSDVSQELSEDIRFMRTQGHKTGELILLPIHRAVLILEGRETEALVKSEMLRLTTDHRNPSRMSLIAFYDLYLSYMLDIDGNAGCIKFWEHFVDACYLFHGDAYLAFYVGLSSFQLYRDTDDTMWLERGRKCLIDMKRFSEQGSSLNFHHKLLLMQAEEYYCDDNTECALLCYDKAIVLSRMHRFINDEALAYERAAIFYFETNKMVESLEHFKLAYKKYHAWGANAKCNDISMTIKKNFREAMETNSSISTSSIDGSSHEGDASFREIVHRKRRATGV